MRYVLAIPSLRTPGMVYDFSWHTQALNAASSNNFLAFSNKKQHAWLQSVEGYIWPGNRE